MYAVQAAVVFHMRETAGAMSGVLLASLVPTAIIGPFAGVFADRWDARRTMILSDAIRAALMCALVFARVLWQMYAISFAMSCVSAFFTPAFSITIPRLVDMGALLKANARLQQSIHAVRIVSPAIAGALVSAAGTEACYLADAASFVISAGLIGTLPRPSGYLAGVRATGEVWRRLVEGIRYARKNATLRFVTLSMAAGVFATGCFTALISIYVRDALRADTGTFGVLGTSLAAGTLTGSVLLGSGRFGRMWDSKSWVAAGLGLVGAFEIAVAGLPYRAAAFAAFFGIGVGAAAAMAAAGALLQGIAPPEMRGRIAAVSSAAMSMAQGSAILIAGSAGARLGVRPVYALSGLLLLALPVSRCFRR